MDHKFKKISFVLSLGSALIFSNDVWGGKKPLVNLNPTPLDDEYGELPYVISRSRSSMLDPLPVKHQGPLGTCGIFGAAACYEQRHRDIKVSEAEATVFAETHLSAAAGGNCKAGVFSLGKTLKLFQQWGFVKDEDILPYSTYVRYVILKNRQSETDPKLADKLKNASICNRNGDPTLDYNGTMTEIKSYGLVGTSYQLDGQHDITHQRLGTIYKLRQISMRTSIVHSDNDDYNAEEIMSLNKARTALANNLPVAAAATVFNNCWSPHGKYREEKDRYRIKIPGSDPMTDDNFQGGHIFVLTGYDDEKQCFKVRNSWGSEWGDNGFAWIPYYYIAKYASELFAVGG